MMEGNSSAGGGTCWFIGSPYLGDVPLLDGWVFRQARAVLLCALLFILWLKEFKWHENPLSMIKIERNCLGVVCAKHIFGDDLKNYFELRFSGFDLSPQVWRANPIQCNPILPQRLSSLDFSVENRRKELGRFCYSRAPTPPGGLDGRVNSIDNCNSATIRNAEGNTLCRNANLWRRYGDARASSYDKAIFRDFGGLLGGICGLPRDAQREREDNALANQRNELKAGNPHQHFGIISQITVKLDEFSVKLHFLFASFGICGGLFLGFVVGIILTENGTLSVPR